MHDSDREKSSSLVHKLVFLSKEKTKRNPFFNKHPEFENSINLHTEDLYEIG